MSEEVDSLQDSVKAAVKERLGNPLVGSFVISWAVTNWEFLLILIRGSAEIEAKIVTLRADYMGWERMLIIPLCAAILLTLAYPWIDWIFRTARSYPIFRVQRDELKTEIALVNLRKELSKGNVELSALEQVKRNQSTGRLYGGVEIGDPEKHEQQLIDIITTQLEALKKMTPSVLREMRIIALEGELAKAKAARRATDIRKLAPQPDA